MKRPLSITVILALLTLGAVAIAEAQEDQGPIAPPPKFEVKRIPAVPHPGPPPIPEQEIIQKFAANEDVMKKAYDAYSFTQTVRVEELSDPGGKFTATGEVYTKADGDRYWRVTRPIESNLKLTDFTLEDIRTIEQIPLFFLTMEEIGNYDFLYAGQDKLDELNTYVFQVKPKELSRKRLFFSGVIWVDDHDLAIVKSYGKFVSEIVSEGTKLPFTMFETYRENFQQRYWLPTYITSDDYVEKKDTQLHLHLVIRSTDFKLGSSRAPGPATPTAPSAAPPPASAEVLPHESA
jgi:outer membrane lipoprotein-sorting protein